MNNKGKDEKVDRLHILIDEHENKVFLFNMHMSFGS